MPCFQRYSSFPLYPHADLQHHYYHHLHLDSQVRHLYPNMNYHPLQVRHHEATPIQYHHHLLVKHACYQDSLLIITKLIFSAYQLYY
jgi:hypothetical protein